MGLTLDTQAWVCRFDGDPGDGAWFGQGYVPDGPLEQDICGWGGHNTYFSTGSVRRGGKRRLEDFHRLLALVGDDIQPDQLQGQPSMILRTSERSRQATIFIDPTDPDARDSRLISGILQLFWTRGLAGGDRSGNNAVRYVRLPQGTNHKPGRGMWQHEVEHWNPGQVMTLEDAAAVFGVDLDEVKAGLTAQPPAPGPGGPVAPFSYGPAGVGQDEKIGHAVRGILAGNALHESINVLAASLVASGTAPGTAVNHIAAIVDASAAPRDTRFEQRRRDIARSVDTAAQKFYRGGVAIPPPVIFGGTTVDEDGVIQPAQPIAEEPPAAPWKEIDFSDLDSVSVPPQEWMWKGYIPCGEVTLLSAHGGTGKSTIALMLAVATAMGLELFDIRTRASPVVFFSAEDGSRTVRGRLQGVCSAMGVPVSALAGRLHLLDATGGDPTLASPITLRAPEGPRQAMAPTETAKSLSRYLRGLQDPLLIVDNASDTMGGNENARQDVRYFVQMLAAMVRDTNGAVLLLAHVDKGTSKGLSQGQEGYSGSTAWNNSVRSRLFMSRGAVGEGLKIEHQKSNLGPMEGNLLLSWPRGGLPELDTAPAARPRSVSNDDDIRCVLRLIAEFNGLGEPVTAYLTGRPTAYQMLSAAPGYPQQLTPKLLWGVCREAHRKGWLGRVDYTGAYRKPRARWQVTVEGAAAAGIPGALLAPATAAQGDQGEVGQGAPAAVAVDAVVGAAGAAAGPGLASGAGQEAGHGC